MEKNTKKWRVTAAEIKGCKMGEAFTIEVKAESEAQAIEAVKAKLRPKEKARVNIVVSECVAVARVTGRMSDEYYWSHAEVTEEAL